MRFDVITLFPGAVRRPPDPRRDAARLRGGQGGRPALAAARFRRRAAPPRRRPAVRRRAGHGDAGRAPRARPGRRPAGACEAAGTAGPFHAHRAQAGPGGGRRLRLRPGGGPALRPLRGRRPALHRSPRRPGTEPRRLRPLRRRTARRWRCWTPSPGCRRGARRPALAPTGQLFGRPARLPALQPARAPRRRRGAAVPEVLLSGNHAAIARWRRERSLELTARRRPDLIAAARASGRLGAATTSATCGSLGL